MAAEPVVVPSTLAALAEEATKKNDEKKEKTRELTRDMFDKVADYVNGELASKNPRCMTFRTDNNDTELIFCSDV